MDKINFQNGVTPVNADTFNTFQNNIEKAIKEQKGTILFDEENGNSSYEINLLDTVDNYEELEVFGLGNNNIRIYQKILNPNQATFEMSSEIMYEGTEYITKALCGFTDNKFYKYQDREYKIDISPANVRTVNLSSWLKITKIIGKNKKS